MDIAIVNFLSERKADRIKKKTNANITQEEVTAIKEEVEKIFYLENWLPDAAKRAAQLSLTTHPGKFTHPGAKSSPIIAENKSSPDGFLRSGNVHVQLDVYGNAASIDVYKFLSITLADGKTILEHLELETDEIKSHFKITNASFEELRNQFLVIKKSEQTNYTSDKIKQIYFPIADDCYHLLSILTPSGLIFELKKRIDDIRFSEQAKQAREDKRNQRYNPDGFDDFYGLTVIGFGGAKPQNISVLNSTNGGKSYLLPSLPPVLGKPYQRLPKSNFFDEMLRFRDIKEEIRGLSYIFKNKEDNADIRMKRDNVIRSIMDYVVEKMWIIRSCAEGWSRKDTYSKLSKHQKIWLDDIYQVDREKNDDWLMSVTDDASRWILNACKKADEENEKLFSVTEFQHIKKIVSQKEDDLR